MLCLFCVATSRASGRRGGPGRTRTCNQTVMSGSKLIRSIDFTVLLVVFDRVCFVLFRLFLVRNWCGRPAQQPEPSLLRLLDLKEPFRTHGGIVPRRRIALEPRQYFRQPFVLISGAMRRSFCL